MTLEVKETTVAEVLKRLDEGAWQVPQFQRDFVWNEGQVLALVGSILAARPIGMVTLWEQPDEHQLPLEKVSIPDAGANNRSAPRYFGDPDAKPNQYYALLDGRQRSTAIAMVFGGLAPTHGSYRFAGKFFLNVAERDPTKQILFKSHSRIEEEGLTALFSCVGQGLFPLSVAEGEAASLFDQWLDYVDLIRDPNCYPNGTLPSEDELNRRTRILREAFRGINDTKLAIYIVPASYNLEKICDIFETLNTTGTKVSTVDLIHASLFQQTHTDPAGPILLREWIDDLGELDGAVGWASSSNRPELIAQVVTATYVALDNKPPIQREAYRNREITSVKSGDLLATPSQHWRNVVGGSDELAKYLGDFQKVVGEGYFPFNDCPYPVSAAIYVGLRWHLAYDSNDDRQFGLDELNSLFCAFFWRNALAGRYNQGFLTQLGDDLRFLKSKLYDTANHSSRSDWARATTLALTEHMKVDVPSHEQLSHDVTTGRNTGAYQKALLLPLVGRTTRDLLTQIRIAFPDRTEVDLHHIYPRGWCANNISGNLQSVLNPEQSGKRYCDSVVNLMPLSRVSNKTWRVKAPGQAIVEAGLNYESISEILDRYFIDEMCLQILVGENPDPLGFWLRRADLMANYLTRRTQIRI